MIEDLAAKSSEADEKKSLGVEHWGTNALNRKRIDGAFISE